jgi:hypothetical protein
MLGTTTLTKNGNSTSPLISVIPDKIPFRRALSLLIENAIEIGGIEPQCYGYDLWMSSRLKPGIAPTVDWKVSTVRTDSVDLQLFRSLFNRIRKLLASCVTFQGAMSEDLVVLATFADTNAVNIREGQ